MEQLIKNVIDWAKERDLIHPENATKQYLKIIEELGETCSAIIKNKPEEIKDGLGDVMVTLIIYSQQKGQEIKELWYKGSVYEVQEIVKALVCHLDEQNEDGCNLEFAFSHAVDLCKTLGFTPEECLTAAWNEIKDRKGETVNGCFIKEEK